jgi:two-component system CheB/CheR fusion protein
MGTLRPNFIVGIGGSAGALDAYTTLLDAIPSKTGMAFVVISHMNPTASSQLAQILSRHTKMKVMVPHEGLPIRKNHVYVIPPNADLLMENYTFKVISPRTRRSNQIDLFLTSIAEVMGANAIGIILSGYDGDGSEGCKQIKAKGGTTFAQDASAEINDMPLSAVDTGCVDFVLPTAKIAKELLKISKNDK